MRALQFAGSVAALLVSALLLRIVLHAYSHHGFLDEFHLAVAVGSGLLGFLMIRRAVVRQRSRPPRPIPPTTQ